MYAYARASLLHYARWMAEHEYPYLEQPEILDTRRRRGRRRTCASATCSSSPRGTRAGDERERFHRSAATFFFDYSVDTLHAVADANACAPARADAHQRLSQHLAPDAYPRRARRGQRSDFGAPTVFVPQKALVKRRVAMTAGAAVLAGYGHALLALIVGLLRTQILSSSRSELSVVARSGSPAASRSWWIHTPRVIKSPSDHDDPAGASLAPLRPGMEFDTLFSRCAVCA